MPTTRRSWKSGTTRRHTGRRTRRHGRTTSSGTTSRRWTPSTSYSPTKYNTYRKDIQAKIASYRTINQQFTGAGKVTAFSPSGANKWMKYVDQGTWVYKFNNAQFCRYFGTRWTGATPSAAFRFLKRKYGAGIKAVTRGKGSNWLVAASSKITSRPFYNYHWK